MSASTDMSRPRSSSRMVMHTTVPRAHTARYFSAATLLITAAPMKRASMNTPKPMVRIVEPVEAFIQP